MAAMQKHSLPISLAAITNRSLELTIEGLTY
jgi:hypothetical protein